MTILGKSSVRPLRMFWVRNVCKPAIFLFLVGQTDLLKLYARVVSCSRAKLNLFADKRQFDMSVFRNRSNTKDPKIEHCISFIHR